MFGLLDNQNWDIAAEHYFQNFSVKAIVYIPCGDAVGSIRAVAHQERRDLISCLLYISDGFCSVCIDRGEGCNKGLSRMLLMLLVAWSQFNQGSSLCSRYSLIKHCRDFTVVWAVGDAHIVSFEGRFREGIVIISLCMSNPVQCRDQLEGLSTEVMLEGIVLVLAPQTLAVLWFWTWFGVKCAKEGRLASNMFVKMRMSFSQPRSLPQRHGEKFRMSK